MKSNNPLPHTPLLRLPQIIGDRKATPPIPALVPVSKSAFYDGIKKGIFPAPIKLGRCSLWRENEIMAAVEAAGGAER